jgi:hypothetical protein
MLKRSLFLGPAVVFIFTSLITLGGCSSGGGDTGGGGSGAAPAIGGTGGSGTGGSGTGGSAPAAGTGNSGAGTGNMPPIPTLTDCDPVKALTTGPAACAQLGCHKGPYSEAKLDLTPNAGFVSRLKNVPATHLDIMCNGAPCATPPTACPTGDKLIDTANADNSWMLHKLQSTQTGCGDAMPPPGYTIDDAGRACIIELVKAIAAQK